MRLLWLSRVKLRGFPSRDKRYTVTTRRTPASRWTAMRVSLIVRDKVTRQCPQTTTFLKRKKSRSGFELRFFCLPAQSLTARPSRLTSFRRNAVQVCSVLCCFTSTESVRTIRDGEPRTSTSTFTLHLSSEILQFNVALSQQRP